MLQNNALKWNSLGVLPPTLSATGLNRSPYSINSVELIEHFSTTKDRCKILSGFLKYRKALHKIGINSGFQWLNGSFMENIEAIESRSPRDIDVVNFVNLQDINQQDLINNHADLFNHEKTKQKYSVDSNFIDIGSPLDRELIKRITYWYSMWSHRRNHMWKGFIQVEFNLDYDVKAKHMLNEIEARL